jgi:hypothetical protein
MRAYLKYGSVLTRPVLQIVWADLYVLEHFVSAEQFVNDECHSCFITRTHLRFERVSGPYMGDMSYFT